MDFGKDAQLRALPASNPLTHSHPASRCLFAALQLNSNGSGNITGFGFSVIPREARAAHQYLYAIHCAEEEEKQLLGGDSDAEQEGLPQVVEETETSTSSAEHSQAQEHLDLLTDADEWSPSAELVQRQPELLRIPFLVQGAWLASTGEVLLLKKHTRGVRNEVLYRGSLLLGKPHGQAATITMHLSAEFASATLTFSCVDDGAASGRTSACAAQAHEVVTPRFPPSRLGSRSASPANGILRRSSVNSPLLVGASSSSSCASSAAPSPIVSAASSRSPSPTKRIDSAAMPAVMPAACSLPPLFQPANKYRMLQVPQEIKTKKNQVKPWV